MYGPHLEVVRVLLSRGAPVNAEDGHGDTPMNWAVNEWAGSDDSTSRDALVEAVRLLVGAGGRMTSAWFEMNDRRRRSLERARADAVLGPLVAGREH
jgi:ankyrin repeat protein